MPSPRKVAYLGKSKTIVDWSKQTGLPVNTIRKRLRHGWTIEQALTTPLSIQGRTRKDPVVFEPSAILLRHHEQMRAQLEKTFRQFIRSAQLELGQLGADYINGVRADYERLAAQSVPGGVKNFAKKPSDRSSPVAQDRG